MEILTIIGMYVVQYLPILLSILVMIANFTTVANKFRSLDYRDVCADLKKQVVALDKRVNNLLDVNAQLQEANQILMVENERLRAEINTKLDEQNAILMKVVTESVEQRAALRAKINEVSHEESKK